MGDFNIDYKTWDDNITRQQDKKFWPHIVDEIIPLGFSQMIDNYTRVDGANPDSKTLLDHIWHYMSIIWHYMSIIS